MPIVKYAIEVERNGKWGPSVKYPRRLSKKALREFLPIPQGYRMAAVETLPVAILGIAEGDVLSVRPRDPNSRIPNYGVYYLEYSIMLGEWQRSACPNQPTPAEAFTRVRNRDFYRAAPHSDVDCSYRVRRTGFDAPIAVPEQRYCLERYGRVSTNGQWVRCNVDFTTVAEAQAELSRRSSRYPGLRYRVNTYDVITDPAQVTVPELAREGYWIVQYYVECDDEWEDSLDVRGEFLTENDALDAIDELCGAEYNDRNHYRAVFRIQ